MDSSSTYLKDALSRTLCKFYAHSIFSILVREWRVGAELATRLPLLAGLPLDVAGAAVGGEVVGGGVRGAGGDATDPLGAAATSGCSSPCTRPRP